MSECNLTTCKHVSDLEREIEELNMIVDAQHNGEGCQLCHCCGEKRHDIAEEDFANVSGQPRLAQKGTDEESK